MNTPNEASALSSSPLQRYDDLISERAAVKRFPKLLGARELRKARQDKEIAFTLGKKGMVFYHPDDLADYLSRKHQRIEPDQKSPLDFEPVPRTKRSIPAQLPESERLYIEHLAGRFSAKRKGEGGRRRGAT